MNKHVNEYYRLKLEKTKKIKKFFKEFWTIAFYIVIGIAVVIMLAVIFMAIDGGIKYGDECEGLKNRIQALEDYKQNMQQINNHVTTNGFTLIQTNHVNYIYWR